MIISSRIVACNHTRADLRRTGHTGRLVQALLSNVGWVSVFRVTRRALRSNTSRLFKECLTARLVGYGAAPDPPYMECSRRYSSVPSALRPFPPNTANKKGRTVARPAFSSPSEDGAAFTALRPRRPGTTRGLVVRWKIFVLRFRFEKTREIQVIAPSEYPLAPSAAACESRPALR